MPDCKSHTYGDGNVHADANCDGNVHTYATCDGNVHRNADANTTGADHAARAWLQSARPANSGPLLEWADLGFHRHLSQRRFDCHRAEPGWCLHRSHQPQWEGTLYV